MKNKGADISPFNAFIETMVDEEKLRQSEIDFGLVTTQFPSLKGVELGKAGDPAGDAKGLSAGVIRDLSAFPDA